MNFPTASRLARLGVSAILFAVGATGVARAELQRVEAVGIYRIRSGTPSRVNPRDEAIAKARWEGVSRVALELIGESAPSEPSPSGQERLIPPIEMPGQSQPAESEEDGAAVLHAALGDDLLPYMRSYRILDDRGEVPVLFKDEPDVAMEYVIVIEVIVDVDRVTSALEDAGLIHRRDSEGIGGAVVVELIGLSRYEAFETILDALREQFGATRVRTIEFSHQRQILVVEGSLGPNALSAMLAEFEDPRLLLEPIGIDAEGGRIRLIGRWFPESDPAQKELTRPLQKAN